MSLSTSSLPIRCVGCEASFRERHRAGTFPWRAYQVPGTDSHVYICGFCAASFRHEAEVQAFLAQAALEGFRTVRPISRG